MARTAPSHSRQALLVSPPCRYLAPYTRLGKWSACAEGKPGYQAFCSHIACIRTPPSTAWPVSRAGMGFKTGDGLESASDIGLGCMGITAFYGAPMSQSDATALLKATYVNCDLSLSCSSGKLSLSNDGTAARLAQLRPLLAIPALFTVAHASTRTHSRQVRCWLPPL
jgi:hypothetical protein